MFLREHVKECLDEQLHYKLLQKVVTLQSWLRSRLHRRRYMQLRSAVIRLQVVSLSCIILYSLIYYLVNYSLSTISMRCAHCLTSGIRHLSSRMKTSVCQTLIKSVLLYTAKMLTMLIPKHWRHSTWSVRGRCSMLSVSISSTSRRSLWPLDFVRVATKIPSSSILPGCMKTFSPPDSSAWCFVDCLVAIGNVVLAGPLQVDQLDLKGHYQRTS